MHFEYQTDRLILRVLEPQDADMVLQFYLNNKEIFERYEPDRPKNFYTLSYHRAMLTAEYNLLLHMNLVRFFVFEKNNPREIIGTVCFRNILHQDQDSCYVGYKFDQRYWHKGYAAEALKKGIDVMFREVGLHRITATIMPTNEPSLKLVQRLGFVREGMEYSSIRIQGKWQDHVRYSVFPDPTMSSLICDLQAPC